MSNVQTERKGDKLIITLDVSAKALANAPRSKTGKSDMVASTGGFMAIGDGLKLAVNLIKT